MIARRLLATGLLLLAVSGARAETVNCTEITSLPYSIPAPGAYCLAHDLSTAQQTGGSILIDASNVVLDCNGHTIANTYANNGTMGIATSGRSGITVANCGVTGFYQGIVFSIETTNSTIRGNTIRKSSWAGIVSWGRDIRILDNSVIDTGMYSPGYNLGIYVVGFASGKPSRDMVVRGNRIVGVSGAMHSTAIGVDDSISPIIENNQIGRIWPASGGTGYGIKLDADSSRAVIRNNLLTGSRSYPAVGVSGNATAICAGNTLNGFRDDIEGCGVDAGNLVN
jgi:hypothetical protein